MFYRIYKELVQSNKKNTAHFLKWAKDMKKYFTKGGKWMARKDMQRYSVSLVMKKHKLRPQ